MRSSLASIARHVQVRVPFFSTARMKPPRGTNPSFPSGQQNVRYTAGSGQRRFLNVHEYISMGLMKEYGAYVVRADGTVALHRH